MLYDIRMKETNAWVGQIDASDAEYAVWAFQDERDLPVGTLMTLVAIPVYSCEDEQQFYERDSNWDGDHP